MNSKNHSFKPQNIRHNNIRQVITLIKNSEKKLSRADISRSLSLSTPSVSSIINDLVKKNIILETNDQNVTNTVGRKPILLKLNKDCGYILGILISEKMLTIALADYKGNLISKQDFCHASNLEQCISFLQGNIDAVLKENSIDIESLLSISISFPGVFDHDKQKIIFAPHSGIWQNEPIIDSLKDKYGCQVKMENNVNAAVLGEKWSGKIGNKNNAVYLKIGNGIAAGVIINCQLYRGYRSLAGEVGFSVTNPNNLNDEVTDSGSFEQRYNTDVILERVKKELADENIDFSDLVKLVKSNDEKTYNIIKDINQNIAMLIINILCILNPEVIVVGGQYSNIIEHCIEEIKKEILNNIPYAPEILISELGDKVYYLGAIANSLQNIEDELIKRYFME